MKKILVADDNEDIREAVKLVLKYDKFDVTTAVNGADCLNKLKNGKFDLIILDVIMPGLGTQDIIDGIKKQGSKAKIILMSGSHVDDVKARLNDKSFKGISFIEKPFENKEFLALVKKKLK